jgi:DNA gyrase/topoisomerase IV subunit A
MIAVKEVVDSDDIVIVTEQGMVIRQHASDIRVAGRNTQGVRLIRLSSGDAIADVAAVVAEEHEDTLIDEQVSAKQTDKSSQRTENTKPSSNGQKKKPAENEQKKKENQQKEKKEAKSQKTEKGKKQKGSSPKKKK